MPNYMTPYAGATPYVAQIAEAIGRRGDIAAQGALARGNAVAQALQGVGQAATQGLQAWQRERELAPQRRLQALQLGQTERQVASQSALADVLKTVPRVTQGGASLYDTQKISEALAQRGFGDAAPEVLQHLEAVNDGLMKSRAAKQLLYGRMIQGVRGANPGGDPPADLVDHALEVLGENGEVSPDDLQKYRAFIAAAPGNASQLMRAIETQLLGPQKLERLGAGDALVDPVTQMPVVSRDEKPTFGQPQAVVDAQGQSHYITQGVVNGKPVLFENGQPYAGPPITGQAARPTTSRRTMDTMLAEAYARGDMREVQRIQGVMAMTKAGERAPQKPEMVFLRKGAQQAAVPVTEANTYLAQGWQKLDSVDVRQDETREQQNVANARRATNALEALDQLVTFGPSPDGTSVVEVKRHPNFNSVFGVMDSVVPTVRPGTADAEVLVNRLVSLVTQPEMQTLRGLGPASDRDVAIIQAGATTLQNRKLSEAAAINELKRLYLSLSRLKRDADAAGKTVPGLTTPGAAPTPTQQAAPSAPEGWRYVPKPGGGWTAVPAE